MTAGFFEIVDSESKSRVKYKEITGGPVDDIGCSKSADLGAHSGDQFLLDGVARLDAVLQRHVRIDALPLDFVLEPAPTSTGLTFRFTFLRTGQYRLDMHRRNNQMDTI